MFRHPGKPYRSGARRGQALVEFALAVPIFILLVMAIFAFGILYENKIALDNAVRSGVRYAATSPVDGSGIEGHVRNSGGTIQIPNHCPGSCDTGDSTCDSSSSQSDGMDICYWDPTVPQRCGYYDGGFQLDSTYATFPHTKRDCLAPGNMVTVRAIVHYQVPVPILSTVISLFFPDGVPIESTATMRMEQNCNCA